MKYQIITAMGFDVLALDVEMHVRKGVPFLVCNDAIGNTTFLEIPGERSKLMAKLVSHRMRASHGRMMYYDGRRFDAITWENWKEFYAKIAPVKPDSYKYAVPLKGPARTEAEEIFEEVKPRLQDLPKHAGRAVYPW